VEGGEYNGGYEAMKPYGNAYIERIARVIAHFHGGKIVINGKTVAAMRGYGSFGYSLDKYTDNHWKEYIQASDAVLQLIKEELDDNEKDYMHSEN
jgi:hypothetical protein